MSFIRRKLGLDRIGIKKILTIADVRLYLDRMIVTLEENHKFVRDAIVGSTAAETSNWKIREATAADVTAGEATAVGNLIVIHKTSGMKHEFEV